MSIKRAIHSRVSLVILGAVIMGFVSGKLLLFNGSVLNTIPWGLCALAVPFVATNGRQAVKWGGIFGFIVSFSFLLFNNTDSKTVAQMTVLVALAAVAALFGLLCGAVLGWLGWRLRRLFSDRA